MSATTEQPPARPAWMTDDEEGELIPPDSPLAPYIWVNRERMHGGRASADRASPSRSCSIIFVPAIHLMSFSRTFRPSHARRSSP